MTAIQPDCCQAGKPDLLFAALGAICCARTALQANPRGTGGLDLDHKDLRRAAADW